MRHLKGRKAIVTGASGGIGVFITEALAREGVDMLLVAFPGGDLDQVRQLAQRHGIRAPILAADLRRPDSLDKVVTRAIAELGRVDLLVNNAGLEQTARYHDLPEATIEDILLVNLHAPMRLAWRVLPGMLKQGEGHIVNVSSLAGRSGPAFQEPYAATKSALGAFTASLRASYQGTGVSASVIYPGFVEAGIYARLKSRTGCSAPALLAGCPPGWVSLALIRAVRHDLPEVIVNRYPIRPILALSALWPRVGEWITRHTGVHKFFRHVLDNDQPTPGF